ncbi:hypothetical protein LAZ67_3005645 [Cordylochernes scorpioides]|uniref:Uncharacterized protein n=1 Tax=Cordylochernes scorpioides TaxID=51811 RepID=A0ABY6KF88_9ARAC|nr:hypothetical protein LAZ67_3005645 [Cordylochernes scorpioides]
MCSIRFLFLQALGFDGMEEVSFFQLGGRFPVFRLFIGHDNNNNLSCPMKSLRCPRTSLSQKSQCPLYWVCKSVALSPCQFSARLRSLLDMRIYG